MQTAPVGRSAADTNLPEADSPTHTPLGGIAATGPDAPVRH